MPSSRATAVTVLPEESTSAIASRLNSSVYRFVYLLPTWCYFLWNLKIPVSRCPRSRGSSSTTAAYRRYADAAEAFLTGEPDGVRDWLLFCCEAFEAGTREVTGIADAVT
jgi:hypothetical protein